MDKFLIFDDVFDSETNKALAEFDYGPDEKWYDLGASPIHEKILDICRAHFDLENIAGYEMWRNTVNPGWHVDKDEKLFKTQKQLVFPQCSAVYYARIENMNGGEFYTEDTRCFPRTNRLILFSPALYHGVSASTGTRVAVSINPWKHRV
jgi:hypothetical protein